LAQLLVALLAPRALESAEISAEELRGHGPLANAAADYLEAFNANDPAALREFLGSARDEESLRRTPVEARLARQQQFREMLGPLSVRAIERSEPAALELIVHAQTLDSFFQLSFEASSLDPLKIGSMGMRPALAPRDDSDSEGGDPVAGAQTLQGLVEALLAEHGMPALAVAVQQGGDDMQSVVLGTRNIETGAPVQDHDGFHIGSITKSMTASIAARLVDREVLDWNLTVGESLTGIPMDAAYRAVTLRQLLQHRSGIEPLLEVDESRERGWVEAGEDPRLQRLALAREVLAEAPAIEPGTSFSYSNAGYAVAAVLLETAADEPWESLVSQEVFQPLEMNQSGLGWPATVERPQQPRGHWVHGGELSVQELTGYSLAGPLAPAGDVYCPIAELARYGWAHLRALGGNESWLSSQSARALHEPPQNSSTPYAMGWMVEEIEGESYHLHSGSAETFFAFLALSPTAKRVIAVAMNDGDLSNDAVAREIVRQVHRIYADESSEERGP
jgi:CubicO group peptidase (beta-lactamase class C family)